MDLNGDGQKDILSGSYSRMGQSMAGLFQVLWGQRGGKFKKAAVLNGTDNEPLIIPIKSKSEQLENICTRPTAVDWDHDGKLDLIVGNFAGTFYLFKGKGSGKFDPKPEPVMSDGKRLALKGHHGDPFMVDWDGDGDLDLLSGVDKGGVQWAENTAGPGKTPILKTFKTLIEPGRTFKSGELVGESDLAEPANSTRVWAADVDEDGKLDILVGDNVTLVSLAPGVSKAEYDKKFAQWTADYEKASKAYSDAAQSQSETESAPESKAVQAARKRMNELYEERGKFMKEERTGYVWLYRRK